MRTLKQGFFFLLIIFGTLSGCQGDTVNKYLSTPTNLSSFPVETTTIPSLGVSRYTSTPTIQIPLSTSPTPNIDLITSEQFKELLNHNGACRLPCWWDVSIEKTSIIDAKNLLSNLGITLSMKQIDNHSMLAFYGVIQYHAPKLITTMVEISASDEIVNKIKVESQSNDRSTFVDTWSTYQPKSLLNEYTIDQAKLLIYSLHPSRETGNVIYRLLFLLSDNQTRVEYRGLTKEIDSGYKICPSSSDVGNLTPALTIIIGDSEDEFRNFLLLDEVSGEKLENIVQGVRSSEDYCLTVARSFWP